MKEYDKKSEELLKENWKFLLIVLIGGLIGGFCVGLYSYDMLSEEVLKQIQEQNVTKEMLAIVSMVQYGIMFGFVLAIIGIILSKRVNLWKEFKFDKEAAIATVIVTIISALILFPGDKIIFGSYNSWVNDQYSTSPTIYKIIAGLLTGGIIEEVMMRLFVMTLFTFVISKIFYKNNQEIPIRVYVISNVLAAILFAAVHLPMTISSTTLTTALVIRCFLFNGGLGLAFGYLYRKHGIGYSMIAHGFAHLIADLLMVLFI